MDQNIKNRLVGIAVIASLAVIFLPMILDGSGVEKAELEVTIPAQPQVPENPDFVVKQLELAEKAEAVPELEPRFVDEDSGENPAPAESTAAAETGQSTQSQTQVAASAAAGKAEDGAGAGKTGGASWVLQVGSFHDRNKALAQRDKLRQSNIAAVFIEQFDIGDQTNFRVRLGPFISRDQTQVAKNKILAKHGIDGLIMEYER
jgi:DedD protein